MVGEGIHGAGGAILGLASFCLVAGLHAQGLDPARQSQRARELMAAGKYEQAIPIYRALVNAMPGNAGLRMDLGVAEHLAGHEREAIPHLQTGLQAQPGNSQLRNMLAAALLDCGRFAEAAAQLRDIAAAAPDDAHACYGLGMSYQGLAEEAFAKLQELDANSPYVTALIADTRVKRRQYRSAFFLYREALKKLPDLHGIHSAVAEVYRKTGHSDWAAEEDAQEAALPAPDCHTDRAPCEFAAGHDLKLLQEDSSSGSALYWKAKAANELALQAFFRLGQLPESVELHQLKAEIARGQGQQMDAVNEWRAALRLKPGNRALERELAISLFAAGDYRAAQDHAEGLLQGHAGDAEIEFVAGDSLLHLEQPERALPHLRAALAANAKLLAADASLGLALSRLGKPMDAIPHLVKALPLDGDGSLHFQLAGAYRAAGDAEKARATMAQYQEIVKQGQAAREEVAHEAQIVPPDASGRR